MADALWGAPVDEVDLNSFEPTDRITLPPGVHAGDRLVVSFDPGGRLDATVVLRPALADRDLERLAKAMSRLERR